MHPITAGEVGRSPAMDTRNIATAVGFVAFLMATEGVSQERERERGEVRSAECVACHGPAGMSPNPTFPILAGQDPAYLESQLQKFQSGERYHPLMTPVAKSLTAEDIKALAVYFSRVGPLAHEG